MTAVQRSGPLVAALLLLGALGLASLPGASAARGEAICADIQPFGGVATGTLDEETPVVWFHRTASSPTTIYLMAGTSDALRITVFDDRTETPDGPLCQEVLCGTIPTDQGLATCEGDAPGDHWIRIRLVDGASGPESFVVTPLGR